MRSRYSCMKNYLVYVLALLVAGVVIVPGSILAGSSKMTDYVTPTNSPGVKYEGRACIGETLYVFTFEGGSTRRVFAESESHARSGYYGNQGKNMTTMIANTIELAKEGAENAIFHINGPTRLSCEQYKQSQFDTAVVCEQQFRCVTCIKMAECADFEW